MTDVKIFKVIGEIKKAGLKTNFTVETRAVRESEALEKVYAELGSRQRAKRFEIKIIEVTEIPPEEAGDPTVLALS